MTAKLRPSPSCWRPRRRCGPAGKEDAGSSWRRWRRPNRGALLLRVGSPYSHTRPSRAASSADVHGGDRVRPDGTPLSTSRSCVRRCRSCDGSRPPFIVSGERTDRGQPFPLQPAELLWPMGDRWVHPPRPRRLERRRPALRSAPRRGRLATMRTPGRELPQKRSPGPVRQGGFDRGVTPSSRRWCGGHHQPGQ